MFRITMVILASTPDIQRKQDTSAGRNKNLQISAEIGATQRVPYTNQGRTKEITKYRQESDKQSVTKDCA